MNEAHLARAISPLRAKLHEHAIYARVNDLPSLRVLMRSHVFAVWDFMSLLKSLQRALTSVTVPWRPPADRRAARLVNAIVLAEESDEIAPGEYMSHFDLYLAAMAEVGADRGPIAAMVDHVGRGAPVREALHASSAPAHAREFVRTTMALAEGRPVHEVAAAFLHGREDLVPEMFRRMLGALDGHAQPALSLRAFRRYLERHVDLDGNDHAPMAHDLLRSICGDDPAKWAGATEAAMVALRARLALWDGVLGELDGRVSA
jgi:plasmid stability protein